MDLSRQIWAHDVFLSFSEMGGAYNFSHNLYFALRREGLIPFSLKYHDEKLGIFDSIPPHLLGAIEYSRILIVVFSRNYVESSRCLEELEKIYEGLYVLGHSVLPVFYGIDPSEVIKQSNNFGKAFAEHEKRFRFDLDKVERWRRAMTQVAYLPGWVVRNQLESQVIDNIVETTMSKLLAPNVPSVAIDELVGIQSRVGALEKLLDIGSYDVIRVVAICGMGGIGKTTLATVVYDRISYRFDACGFFAHANEAVCHLQEQLIRQTLKVENLKIRDVEEGTFLTGTRLKNLKTLIVLDGVDEYDHWKKLAGNLNLFGAGSRIIITTRDQRILRHGVDEIYKVELLKKDEALRLFCRNVFKWDYPFRGYEEVVHSALEYANGLPLAIKSLASSLLCRQSVSQWRRTLAKVHKSLDSSLLKVLVKSFLVLDQMEKEIFLDIACFFVGKNINYVEEILRHFGFKGLGVLVDKSLITISDNRIQMHYMLQKLGWEIVRQEDVHLGRRSRLWLYKDFCNVARANKGTEKMQAIVVDQQDLEETALMAEAISKMSGLRLLILRNVNISGGLYCLSKNLIYLSWHNYPFPYLPSSFESHKLVELIMPCSSIIKLWEGKKMFVMLRNLDLHGSKNLIKTPDFSEVQNLERVNLEECTGLLLLHPSVGRLRKLKLVNLRNCPNLVSIPNNLFGLSSLENLNLAGCSKLAEGLNFDSLRSLVEVKLLTNPLSISFRNLSCKFQRGKKKIKKLSLT